MNHSTHTGESAVTFNQLERLLHFLSLTASRMNKVTCITCSDNWDWERAVGSHVLSKSRSTPWRGTYVLNALGVQLLAPRGHVARAQLRHALGGGRRGLPGRGLRRPGQRLVNGFAVEVAAVPHRNAAEVADGQLERDGDECFCHTTSVLPPAPGEVKSAPILEHRISPPPGRPVRKTDGEANANANRNTLLGEQTGQNPCV